MFTVSDHEFMAEALRLAEQGLYTTDPNPRVGCVIVKDGKAVGRSFHHKAGEAHAEVLALHEAGEQARDATVYTTLEPCAHFGRTGPCADALIAVGVARVIASMQDPNPLVAGKGFAKLRAAGIETASGLLEEQTRALNPGFISRMMHGRPWVRSKLAVSLDGRTALAGGESKWISCEAAREDAQRWRARSSAILTGIGTVLKDDPALTVRLTGDWRQPRRIVVDSGLRTPPAARILKQPGETHIAMVGADAAHQARLTKAGATLLLIPAKDGHVDLAALLQRLAEMECNEVLVEAGPGLNGGLLAAGLVDEFIIYMAPCLLGDTARGMFSLPALKSMQERIELQMTDIRTVGNDLRVIAMPTERKDHRG
ncbi:MAG: bifunctional diaminohydroxyphosphoribosylaminopyrimidine deaminase/5-amino-6-(5-phosphoribosylamino)uracil reductase RibD [Gammaproteobacteria bacterium]|nr:bifunctional diaminohydroxyphosphoribosylaminopyrimidine deaminase/5-amino-6-(5-phosphoribosylamino)uracil reductase RibD [Gammaproteobacteria bacterium]MBU6509743.1 bifunctional diaminohydroxyphosphoribosylaminopyrimidine deaminase/5-amino-6-(5-phosphoribosylamino)uracil reductase RibD [Gammaproteobacteria bacterium]MDE1984463.1 bifunctional diaminohydroxyphosphoribosylaminopyrimidine deaminase/5-amino-6-(5-phosphoribosylamino)uracil reductase RibD [Gammaproteobacteria bacterium]MDE2109342.1